MPKFKLKAKQGKRRANCALCGAYIYEGEPVMEAVIAGRKYTLHFQTHRCLINGPDNCRDFLHMMK